MASEKKSRISPSKLSQDKFKIELPRFISEMELEDIIGQPPSMKSEMNHQLTPTIRSSSLAEICRRSKTPSSSSENKGVRSLFRRRDMPKYINILPNSINPRKGSMDTSASHHGKDLATKFSQAKQKNEEMESLIRLMETRHRFEMDNAKKRYDKLAMANKKLSDDKDELEARLNEEILKLRRQNEENLEKLNEFFKCNKDLIESLMIEKNENVLFLKDSNSIITDEISEDIQKYNKKIEEICKVYPKIGRESNIIHIKNFRRTPSTGETDHALIKTITFRKETSAFNSPSETFVSSQATALFNFTAKEPDELGFNKHDRITIISQNDDGWWIGKIGENIGKFPCSFVLLDS
ncbi:unnamed protein product [Blepharisma stoltei]|uniref:SH3 domain-containing protein n=1 Tax=Blepharisma stoltei TaxID=1481888 RepID=A0AAU9K3C9_9CILI|nr:unnamed protein product [Blepharisma stoltei]